MDYGSNYVIESGTSQNKIGHVSGTTLRGIVVNHQIVPELTYESSAITVEVDAKSHTQQPAPTA
jgi:hypothetical protein